MELDPDGERLDRIQDLYEIRSAIVHAGSRRAGLTAERWQALLAIASRYPTRVDQARELLLAEPGYLRSAYSDVAHHFVDWSSAQRRGFRLPAAALSVRPNRVSSVTGCAFCGSTERLTREHVLGAWLSGIGLEVGSGRHRAGWLNRINRDLGGGRPFTQTVRDICARCNNGWMSQLESVARRVLPPLILGESAVVEPGDLGAIATWTHKTALVAMLVSSAPDRAAGYGLPSSEYRTLFDRPDPLIPPPRSEFWIGRYLGPTTVLQQVTPMVVHHERRPEPKSPQAYLMTIVLGQLILQGVRFTNARSEVTFSRRQRLPRLWPERERIAWPAGAAVDEAGLAILLEGKDFRVAPPLVIAPWRQATELTEGRIVGSTIEVQTPCGRHVISFPVALAALSMKGRVHAFKSSCECGQAYLVETQLDGAHFKMAGPEAAVISVYDEIPGTEISMENAGGGFACKPVGAAS